MQETNQSWFDCTLPNMFTEGKFLVEATDVVTSYTNFCTKMLIPTRAIKGGVSKQKAVDNQIT